MNKRFVGVLTFAFIVAAGASLVLYRVLINRPTREPNGLQFRAGIRRSESSIPGAERRDCDRNNAER